MKIKLLREVLVGPADVTPTRGGTVVDLDDVAAKEFIAVGLAVAVKEGEAKAIPAAPKNKMAASVVNKGATSDAQSDENRDTFEREPARVDADKPVRGRK